MKLFIQGMRRSGTTILFDALAEDPDLDVYYEPLAAANKPALGGGSGAREVDYFEKIRAVRAEFARNYPRTIVDSELNHGAPRDPALEFQHDLPDALRAYIRFMLDQREHTAIKFTRAYCKVPALAEIEPGARFLHLVRDPRAVTSSYLIGKKRRNAAEFTSESAFFDRTTERTAWSSYALSEHILRMPEYNHLAGCEDFFRVLLIWAYTFRSARRDGLACFGDRYRLLCHEDLVHDPVGTLRSLYEFLDRPLPQSVVDWAAKHIRKREEPFAARSGRWREAMTRLKLEPDLQAAGYSA